MTKPSWWTWNRTCLALMWVTIACLAGIIGWLLFSQPLEPRSAQLRHAIRQRDALVKECESNGMKAKYDIFDTPGYSIDFTGDCVPK